MAFTIYKSTDSGAPILYGTTGSAIVLLNACLYSGYGTMPSAGWLKPVADTGSLPASPLSITLACYKQPSGSGMTLVVNDGAPNATSLYKEAWATGWESLLNYSQSVTTAVGSGSGQFPLPAQLLTNGHAVIRKSLTADSSSARPWVVAADPSTFYLFVGSEAATTYYAFGFGDIYSFKSGSADDYRCILMGRNTENSALAAPEGMDLFSAIGTAVVGNFMPRTFNGLGTSITVGKHGDGVKGSATTYLGNIPFPNSTDTSLYISPVWVCENATSIVRGQLRGLYQLLHPVASFTDRQIFSGSADFSAKTFMAIKASVNAGVYILETSDTLLTN